MLHGEGEGDDVFLLQRYVRVVDASTETVQNKIKLCIPFVAADSQDSDGSESEDSESGSHTETRIHVCDHDEQVRSTDPITISLASNNVLHITFHCVRFPRLTPAAE